MTVYKYFIRVALKNKMAIFIYISIFFALSILTGLDLAERDARFTGTRLNIGIIDNSNTELSNELRSYLEKENEIVDTIDDEDYIREQVFLEMVDAVIVIPKDLDRKVVDREKILKVYRDERKIESMQIQNQVNKFLMFANSTYEDGSFNLVDVRIALDEKADVKLIDDSQKNASIDEWFKYYYNFTSYVIIGIYIAVIGLVMADFKDEDIFNRSKISSKKFLNFNGEVYLGQLTIASLITLVFILGSVVLKGKYIREIYFTKYLINTVVFSLAILCLTFLINNLTRNSYVINGISIVLSLGTSFISGVMVPQELLGKKTLALAKFFPSYYFVRVNEMEVASFSDMRLEILIQLLFAMIFLLSGLYLSKRGQKL